MYISFANYYTTLVHLINYNELSIVNKCYIGAHAQILEIYTNI